MSVEFATIVIARKLIDLARQVLADDAVGVNIKVGRNTLADSDLRAQLEANIKTTDDIVVTLLFNHYVEYIERGRPPKYGKKPPIDALKDWAEKNGISTDASTLWAISTAIWRDGYAGRPVFATLDKLVDKAFADGWADQIFEEITEQLTDFFNT